MVVYVHDLVLNWSNSATGNSILSCDFKLNDMFFVSTQNAEEHISSKEVLLNTYPVTLINVDDKLVYQTIFASVHAIKRRDNLKTEGSMLLHGTELNDFKTR